MKNCLIIINKNAGTSKKISFEKVEKCLGSEYKYEHRTIPGANVDDTYKFDAVAVCGGDGTLGSILNVVHDKPVDLYYFPVGTLNDKAKAQRYEKHKSECPSCNGTINLKPVVYGKCEKILSSGKYETTDCAKNVFAYVFAAGSFTPIGYTSDVKSKKKFGVLAYVSQVLKEYKPHRIKAQIVNGKRTYEGEFTLIMFLKSPRCFGFHFNRAFDQDSASGHLLAIRSPKNHGAVGYIQMFFPFFKAFFLGLKKERARGDLIFEKVYSSKITLKNDIDFCKDGEKQTLKKGEYKISFAKSVCNFSVIEKF